MPLAASRLEVLQVRKLIQCVRQQDEAQITKMVELGIEHLVDYQDPDTGESALHVACSLNYNTLVIKLLMLGANPLLQDNNGLTPAMTACSYGHLQALEALSEVKQGITSQLFDKKGGSIMVHCMHPTQRHAKCLDYLLEMEVEPNLKSQQGTPILCSVCSEGLDKLLERLLDKGADPSARDPTKDNKPAIVLAAEGNHAECIKLLMVSGVDKNAVFGTYGMGAIHRAAALGHFESIQTLSAYGADFSLSTDTGENAMHMATKSYKLLCTRLLGQRGCPANQNTKEEGLTPQKIAKNEGYKDAMKELKKLTTFQDKVERGAKPKGYAEPWAVRLFDWMVVNKPVVIDVLKEHDTNKSGVISTEEFTTSLQGIGVPLQSEEFDKLLKIYDKKGEGKLNYEDFLTEQKFIHAQYKLKPGDDIKAKAKKGKKGKKGGKKGKGGKTKILFPIYFEEERPPTAGVPEGVIEREEFVTDVQRFPRGHSLPHTYFDDSPWYLIHPDRQYIQLYEAVRHGNLESLESALSLGLSVDCRDKYNKTPLMVASAHGRVDVVKYLLEKGADVNAFDNFQWTALHHASHSGEEAVVKLLLDGGGNIDAQSVNGGTPLMRAIETSQKDMVKLLLERGAKVTLENKHGDTALDVAKNWGDDFIYAIVYAKAATLPPPVEKKGKEKGGAKKKDAGKGKGKKGKKGSKDSSLPKILPGPPLEPLPPPPRLPTPAEYVESARRRCSVGGIQTNTLVKPSPNYKPRPAWVSRPSSMQSLLDSQTKAREERGIESTDFGETRTPFQLQMIARVQALEVTDA